MRLRIFLLEVSEEGRIGEMLETGGVVGHDVHESWEILGPVTVSVRSLVGAGVVAQVGCRTIGGDRSLVSPADCWRVVATVGQSGVSRVVGGAHQ